MSSKGNRTLCIVNGLEKYDTLKTSMGSVISDINLIKNGKIEVDGIEVKVEMFLGGTTNFCFWQWPSKGQPLIMLVYGARFIRSKGGT